MTPKQVADKICESIPSDQPLIASTSTAPNGFINIHLSSALMGEVIASVIRDGPEPPCMQKMKIVVDQNFKEDFVRNHFDVVERWIDSKFRKD